MNSTTTLRASHSGPDKAPRSRLVLSKRRVRFSTVALEHVCEDQQQQGSSYSACIGEGPGHQHMQRAVEDAWQIPSASHASSSDLHALTSSSAILQGGPVRIRRGHQRSERVSRTLNSPTKQNSIKLNVVVSSAGSSISSLATDAAASNSREGTFSSTARSTQRTSSSRSARLTFTQEQSGSGTESWQESMAVKSRGLDEPYSSALLTLVNVWHLHVQHNSVNTQQDSHGLRGAKPTVFANDPPRLLTAAEEATLGSMVQQYRKLFQVYLEHPHLEETVLGPPPPALQQRLQRVKHAAAVNSSTAGSSSSGPLASSSSSIHSAGRRRASSSTSAPIPAPAEDAAGGFAASSPGSHASSDSSSDGLGSSGDVSSVLSSSTSSSTSSSHRSKSRQQPKVGLYGEAVHGNTQWPPPLTGADVQEVVDMPPVYRKLLPDVAQQAQQLLVGYNTRLVAHMLQFCRHRSMPAEDLIAAGLTGLKLAAGRYDPSRKTRFSTVASSWILQHMQRTADQQQGSYRTPHRYGVMLRYVLQNYGADALAGIENQPKLLQQVAKHFKTKPSTVLHALRSISSSSFTASLDSSAYDGANSRGTGEDSFVPLAAVLTSTDLDEDSEDGSNSGPSTGLAGSGSYMAAAGQLPTWMQHPHAPVVVLANSAAGADADATAEQQVVLLLQVLTWRERNVMQLLYGDDADELMTQAAGQRQRGRSARLHKQQSSKQSVSLTVAARQLGLSIERVRQVRDSAFRKLRIAAGAMTNSSSNTPAGVNGHALTAAPAEAAVGLADATHEAEAGTAGIRLATAAAIHACPTRTQPMLWALLDFYSLHQAMPSFNVDHQGCRLGIWCSKQYTKYKQGQGRLSPQLLHALEMITPAWVEGMQQRQHGGKHLRPKEPAQKCSST